MRHLGMGPHLLRRGLRCSALGDQGTGRFATLQSVGALSHVRVGMGPKGMRGMQKPMETLMKGFGAGAHLRRRRIFEWGRQVTRGIPTHESATSEAKRVCTMARSGVRQRRFRIAAAASPKVGTILDSWVPSCF